MFLIIDNYDSFTWNLAQAFMRLGKKPIVLKNDDPELLEYAQNPDLEMVCISPGPGHPAKAGLCLSFLDKLSPNVPVLGICLGHQILGLHAGGDIEIAPVIMHGKQSEITHNEKEMFCGISSPALVGRYHSLVVKENEKTKRVFEVTARGPNNEIMALRYKDRPWYGAQFHPESVLTAEGSKFLSNFPEALLPKKDPIPFSKILAALAKGEDLSNDMAEEGFAQLMDGKLTSSQAGAFLMGLHSKGESPLEIANAIKQVVNRAVPTPGIEDDCIDIVGTGGDGKNSFNCSTASALILAGMGYKVAKHGNRAASSVCGAADALEALGIKLDNDPASVAQMLEKRNFAFLFAPYFHPSFKNVGPIRRELGMPTIFNILGPMVNPAQPSHLLMGVAKPELIPVIAKALMQTSIKKAAVVCGAGGYDEVTPLGSCDIAIIDNGELSWLRLDPAQFGISPPSPEDLACKTKEEAVAVLKQLLEGKGPKAMRDMLILNVGMAIFLMEKDLDLNSAMAKARAGVNSGAGMKVLENA